MIYRISNLRLGARLAVAFGLISLALALVSVVAFAKLSTISSEAKSLGKGADARATRSADQIGRNVQDIAHQTASHRSIEAENAADFNALMPLARSQEARSAAAAFRRDYGAYLTYVNRAIAGSRSETLRNAQDGGGSRRLYEQHVVPSLDAVEASGPRLERALQAQAAARADHSASVAGSGKTLITIIALVALALAAALAVAQGQLHHRPAHRPEPRRRGRPHLRGRPRHAAHRPSRRRRDRDVAIAVNATREQHRRVGLVGRFVLTNA